MTGKTGIGQGPEGDAAAWTGRAAEIAGNVRAVRARLAQAAARVGRNPAEVRLVAVSKGFGPGDVALAAAAGLREFGENRVQEALPKVAALAGVRWHLIGQLQRNKCRAVAGRFALVHGVDRPDLAESLQRAALAAGVVQDVLVQVSLAGLAGQGGVAPGEARALLDRLGGMSHLRVRGLMVIAPAATDPEAARPAFSTLRTLRDRLEQQCQMELPELSMGMSGDYVVAVEEGATLVRVGRAIFGARAAPGAPEGIIQDGAELAKDRAPDPEAELDAAGGRTGGTGGMGPGAGVPGV